jgi:hypothetical protein
MLTYFIQPFNRKSVCFVLETSCGNRTSIPIAVGVFSVESAENYTHFLEVVKCLREGALGYWLNSTRAVVCTDRHQAFAPAMRAALPLAHHRHDLRHVILNLNDKGYVSKHMLGAQKATTYGDFLICMQGWIKEQPEVEALLHPDRLDPNTWTYYAALNNPHPYYLFGLTGSQIVEGEMNHLKISGVRHELPLKAMTNFIDLYARVVEGMKVEADEMVAGGKLLTTYTSLVCRCNLNVAQHYDVRHLEKHKYEVKRKGQLMRAERAWKASRAGICLRSTCRGLRGSCKGSRSSSHHSI